MFRIEKNKPMARNEWWWSAGRKSQKVETGRYRIARIKEENGGVPPVLATGLGHVWHSLPFVGVEQRWWSAAMRGGKHCARKIRWQLVAVPYSHVDPCSCLAVSKAIGEDPYSDS